MKLRKGLIHLVDGIAKQLQTCKISGLAGEVAENIPRFQNFGFSSIPVESNDGKGAEVIIADLGSADRRVIIATDDRRYRPRTGNPGDVCIYGIKDDPKAPHALSTQRLTLLNDGSAILNIGDAQLHILPSGEITLKGNLNLTGNLQVTGNISSTGTLHNNGTNVGSTHTHINGGGTGNSGVPS